MDRIARFHHWHIHIRLFQDSAIYYCLSRSERRLSFSPAIYNSPRPRAIQMHSVITDILCNHCNTSITAFNPHPAIRRHKNISLAKLFSLMDTLSCTEASMFLSKSTPPFLFSLAQTYTPKLIVVLAHELTTRRDGSICWHRWKEWVEAMILVVFVPNLDVLNVFHIHVDERYRLSIFTWPIARRPSTQTCRS